MLENNESKEIIHHPEQLTKHDMQYTFTQALELGCAKYLRAIKELYTEYHNGLFDSHESAFEFLNKEFQQRGLGHKYSLYADQEVLEQQHTDYSQKKLKEYFSRIDTPYVFVKSTDELSPPIQDTITMNDQTLFGTTALAYAFILKETNAGNDGGPKTFTEMFAKFKSAFRRKKTGSFASYNEEQIASILEQ